MSLLIIPMRSRRALETFDSANWQDANLSTAEAWMPTQRVLAKVEVRREFLRSKNGGVGRLSFAYFSLSTQRKVGPSRRGEKR